MYKVESSSSLHYEIFGKNAQSEFAVKKPKPLRLKPKPQKLPQNRTAK